MLVGLSSKDDVLMTKTDRKSGVYTACMYATNLQVWGNYDNNNCIIFVLHV